MYDFGYDIADFYAIQEEYGTMEDFERLIARANELGTNMKSFLIVNSCCKVKPFRDQSYKTLCVCRY